MYERGSKKKLILFLLVIILGTTLLPAGWRQSFKMKSVRLTEKNLKKYDCVVISTDHTSYDHTFIAKHAKLIIDTRNAMKKIKKKTIVKA